MRKVLPFLKTEYFIDEIQQTLFVEIDNFVKKYSQNPTKEILTLEVNKRTDLTGKQIAEINKLIGNLDYKVLDFNWLIDATESWCKERAIYLALTESIQIANNQTLNKTRDSIPSILQEALSVSFDTHIGHNYIEDAIERYDFLNQQENRVPYGLAMLDKVTGGGAPNKTLTIFLAGPGAGKSLCMCNHAANVLSEGKNVLYITLEMAEEKIAQRIDANILNLEMNDLIKLKKEKFVDKITSLRKKTSGTLIIKEYPTASAHSGHFQALLDELKLKKSFVPDIIFVDYLNICISSRYSGKGMNSYSFIKAIAEEIRSLAVRHNLPIVSATQINREGFNSSDPDMTNTSECIFIDELVETVDGKIKKISDVIPGDQLISQDEFKTVMFVHHRKPKECIKITLKSGKTIIVSKDHIFPTKNGRKSFNTGLDIGDFLNSR